MDLNSKRKFGWVALLLLCSTQFMVVLDGTLVNVALPSIQQAMHISQQNLQWITNAYLLMFAGFMMLGGRVADVLGRRRVFISGMLLFAVASLLGGFAPSDLWLIAARVAQGLGAAIISPAALSILTITFPGGKERDRALGVFGAAGGSGAVAGLLLGGVLTEFLGWQWVFFVNFPVGLLVALLSLRFLQESRVEESEGGFDLPGAVSVTGGLVLLVYALVQTGESGWLSAGTLSFFAAAFVLLALFVLIELKSRVPMVNFKIFRYHNLTAANLISILFTACLGGTLFLMTLYLQQVLRYSALEAGLALLPFELATIIAATVSARLVTRFGAKPVVMGGLTLLMLGLLLLSRLPANGAFLTDVLPATLLFGFGLTGSGIPLTITAVAGVPGEQAGTASGLINTTQQVGFSLGLAVLATIASAYSGNSTDPAVLTSGFNLAFTVAVGFALLALVLAFMLLRSFKAGNQPEEATGAARIDSVEQSQV
ncbi:MAG TPA: MFS transporter [Chloroflexia bacterium]|nr:MFS transporter [Chloroflexia bacterium]